MSRDPQNAPGTATDEGVAPLHRTAASDLVVNAARRLAYAAQMLANDPEPVLRFADALTRSLRSGGKILVFGNGGSAASAQHFAAEFTGKLCLDRRPYPAISLTVDSSATTAIANDYSFDEIFARQVLAFGKPEDIAVGLSTSGSSRNVHLALEQARALGMTTVALTGPDCSFEVDVEICVPVRETARVQELHDLILHQGAQLAERQLDAALRDDRSADRFPFLLGERDLRAFAEWIRDSGQSLVTTNGCFDLLHEGHHWGLGQTRALGDRLVVLVNSDASVTRLKGPTRPVRDITGRISDLRRSPHVDHVVVMEDDEPSRLLELLTPGVHCKGEEYRGANIPEEAVVRRGGGRMEFLPRLGEYSTSGEVRRITGAWESE